MASASSTCADKMNNYVLQLVKLDGFAEAKLCENGQRRDCVIVQRAGDSPLTSEFRYSGQYSYGGNDPNINDYVVTVSVDCEVSRVEISRN